MIKLALAQVLSVCALLALATAACNGDDAVEGDASIPGDGDGDGGGDGDGDGDGDSGVPEACTLPFDPGECDAFIPRFAMMSNGRCDRVIYGGCGGNDNNFPTIEACEETCQVDCKVVATDTRLPGVAVRVEADHCTVVAGEDSTFSYRIEIDDPIEYTQPASTGCGPCGDMPLVSYEIGAGPVLYNESDVGCCPPLEESDKILPAEPITGAIEWPGVQWRGPSDTDRPFGPPFPHGNYEVRVTIDVPGKGSVAARLPITVVGADSFDEGRPCASHEYVYPSGDATFPDPTSCNTCSCEDGEVTACTEIGCPTPCAEGTAVGTECASCGPTDACLIVRTACLPVCEEPGDCAGGGFCRDGVCANVCG